MAFGDLASEITGTIPGISPILAANYVRRAWRDVCAKFDWSFLYEEGAVVCPTQIVAGTVHIIQFTNTVTCSAAASAALLIQNASTPTLIQMQMRFNAGNAASEVYSITAVDQTNPAAIVLTMDRVVQERTNVAALYQCYRCYVDPPQKELMKRWESVTDMVNGFKLNTTASYAYFDSRDPQRLAQGLGYFIGRYKTTAPEGTPRYEIWPHPTSGQTFVAMVELFQTVFEDPDDVLPSIIPEELVINRVYSRYAYPWAMSNAGRFPELQKVNWNALQMQSKDNFTESLMNIKKQDNAMFNQRMLNQGHLARRTRPGGFYGPIDANYMQRHAVTW